MKKLMLPFAFSFLMISSSYAEEYKAPNFKWKNKSIGNIVKPVNQPEYDRFKENSYRVQEKPESQRDLASEKKEKDDEMRGPSSEEAPARVKSFDAMTPKPWKYRQ